MEVIGILFFGLILFIALGIGGWLVKGLEVILEFLSEGCAHSIGCLFWIIIIVILIAALC